MAKKDYGVNVKAEIVKGKLILECDITQEHGESKSGKTITVASTKGNVRIQTDDGEELIFGLNLYKYPKKK